MEILLYWIGLAAVAVVALTGVLDAGRKQMDIVGAVMVGCVTALGGGTVRDLLLDRKVFWIADQTYLIVTVATTLVVFFAVRGRRLPMRLFLIPDAIGLALFTIAGTQIALGLDAPWLVASLLGVITGVLGGVLRDVLCNDVPLIFVRASGINDFPDLAGKNVVTTAGTTSERLIRKMNDEKNMGMNIISAKDHGESFLTLETGRAVAFMMDDALLYGEMAKAKRPGDWAVVGKAQSKEACLRLHAAQGRPGLQEGGRRGADQGDDLWRSREDLRQVVHEPDSAQGPESRHAALRRDEGTVQGAQRQGFRIRRRG